MVDKVIQPAAHRPITGAMGVQSREMRDWMQGISDRAVIVGEGQPENVVSASQGALYMNQSGVAGAILYVKRDKDIGGDTTQGWIAV